MIKKCLFISLLTFIIVLQIVFPSSETLSKDIENDSIKKIIIIETESITLNPIAHDPDEDAINYRFSEPLNEYGNWQTTYGDAGEHKVTIIANDGDLSTSKEIIIIVNKKEEIPTIDSLFPKKSELTINEGSQISFKVVASDLNKDELSYVWSLDGEEVSKQNPYTYQTSYFDSGLHKIKLDLSDGTHTLNKEWEITVKNKDRAPNFESIKTTYMKENEIISLKLDVADPDNDELEIWAENLPEGASFVNQEFHWQPNYDTIRKDTVISKILHKLNFLYKRFKINFFVKSNDIIKKKSLKIWVKDVNRAPQLQYPLPIYVNEGELFFITPNATDADGDKISFSYSGWINKDSHTTSYEDAGKYKVRITASDGFLTDVKDVDIIVKNINRVPILELESQEIYENEKLTLEINPLDFDGDLLDISVIGLPRSAKLKENMLSWTPDYDFLKQQESKNIIIKFNVNDGDLNAEEELVITVHNKNRAPKIVNTSSLQALLVYKNSKIRFDVMAEDPDNDKLYYLWEFGFLEKYNASKSHLRTFKTTGKKTIKVIVSDGKESVSHTWNLNVVERPVKTEPKTIQKTETAKKVEESKLNLQPQKVKKPEPLPAPKKKQTFKTYKIEG